MKVVVIGGTGHIGSYLIPLLVESGHDVVAISRGNRQPYFSGDKWQQVEHVRLDRGDLESKGEFGAAVAGLETQVVIDLICYNRQSGEEIVDALAGKIDLYLCCGTIWVHGHSEAVPTTESAPRRPFGDYGEQKAQLEAYLLEVSRTNGFPATIIHPGHIVGEGWAPLNPEGHFDPEVWKRIASGERVTLPNLGLETVHHVHAFDVARLFLAGMENPSEAVGESFHAVSEQALTLRGYAEAAFRWYGKEPNLAFVPWEELKKSLTTENASFVWDHISHSPCCSIQKARNRLAWSPHYSSLDAVHESVRWLEANERI